MLHYPIKVNIISPLDTPAERFTEIESACNAGQTRDGLKMTKLRRQLRMTRKVLTPFALINCLLFGLPIITAQQSAVHENPVIAGDHPDPSVIRVGHEYWATVTSGTWEPEFVLFHSRNLLNWEVSGAVFQKRPDWAERDFWAPEISEDHGRFFVYYTARKKSGSLCVAVATASSPSGPYTDQGPLVCQEDGSIDAMAVSDERGGRYLVWKEDGNSRNQPTPIWAQKLSNDGLKLLGKKTELIRNDSKSWEGGVVEGAFILRRGAWFYLFYSGNSCCGRRCNYALGVARSRNLLGPYEKHPANPILAENQTWQCPGHGSIVTDDQGRDFLLYHTYRRSESAFFIGREAVLDQVSWGPDGWPKVNEGRGPSGGEAVQGGAAGERPDSFFYGFNGQTLATGWQWPQSEEPSIRIETEGGGWLRLSPTGKHAADALGAIVSQPVRTASFVATTLVDTSALKPESAAGLSAYQGSENAIGITVGRGKVSIYLREGKRHQIISSLNALDTSRIYLRMTVTDGSRFRFAFSQNGSDWKNCGNEIDVAYLESVRIALTAGGDDGGAAKFAWLRVAPLSSVLKVNP
jgi:xylan 1,4-beta-xylosidase